MSVQRVALQGARRILPRNEELRERLVGEWAKRPGRDPRPEIIEDIVGGQTVHIYVVWDEWAGMSQEERSEIIMDAYEEWVGLDTAVIVTIAMGLTHDEEDKVRVQAVRGFPTLDTGSPDGFASFVRLRVESQKREDIEELVCLAREIAAYALTGEGLSDEAVISATQRLENVITPEGAAKLVLLGANGRAKLKRGEAVTTLELYALATLARGLRDPIRGDAVSNRDAREYLVRRGIRL